MEQLRKNNYELQLKIYENMGVMIISSLMPFILSMKSRKQINSNFIMKPCLSKCFVTVVVLILFSHNMVAQQGQSYPQTNTLYERTWLATDRDVYIPGDKILVSLATIDGYYQLPLTFSAVAYIELYTANGTPIVQEKALLRNGKGSVQLKLPKNIETDYYYLRAYTNYQKNFGENSFMVKKIRLINPFRIITIEKRADTLKTKSVAYKYSFLNDSLYITCNDSTLKDSFTVKSAFDNEYVCKNTKRINDSTIAIPLRGMKNVLSVSASGEKSNLLISDSVRNITVMASNIDKSIHYSSNSNLGSNSLVVASAFRVDHGKFYNTYCLPSGLVTVPKVFVYQPELTADILFGKITLKAGVTLPKHILVTIPRSISSMMVATIEPDSSFSLNIGNQYSNTSLIFTPTDTSSAILINLKDEFFPIYAIMPHQVYIPEEYLGTYIQSLMVNVQLDDAFNIPSKSVVDDKNTFYGAWDEKLDFDNFIKLPSIEEYIHELLPSVYVIKRRKHKSIRISDYNARGFIGKNPLLIVDGTPYFNHGTVLYLPPTEVKTAYILNRKLTFLSAQFDGVLDIRTRNNYSEELNLATNTLSVDYISPKIYNDHIPLFSNTTMWQPFATFPLLGQFSRIQSGPLMIRLQGLSDGKPFDVYSEIIK